VIQFGNVRFTFSYLCYYSYLFLIFMFILVMCYFSLAFSFVFQDECSYVQVWGYAMSHTSPMRFSFIPSIMLPLYIHIGDNV
jgi:hypothetical protein